MHIIIQDTNNIQPGDRVHFKNEHVNDIVAEALPYFEQWNTVTSVERVNGAVKSVNIKEDRGRWHWYDYEIKTIHRLEVRKRGTLPLI